MNNTKKGSILKIDRMVMHNGPGIRTEIFFKGCPLRCKWCSTPESQACYPEIGYLKNNCVDCGTCSAVCPRQAVLHKDHSVRINRSVCDSCGICVSRCPSHALRLYGRQMTVLEILREIRKDSVFYKNSGGGITISGGEPFAQAEFLDALVKAIVKEGYTVGLDTTGYAKWEQIESILPYISFFLWDIKHMDEKKHLAFTEVSNKPILENLIRVSQNHIPIIIRVPMITGLNDSAEEIRDICKFVRQLPSIETVDLLRLHHLGELRYQSLDRIYPIAGLPMQSREYLSDMKQLVESYGLSCRMIE